jgi:hypothetical protein
VDRLRTVADVAAGLAESARRVELDPGRPVPRNGEYAAPGVGDRDTAGLWQDGVQHPGQIVDGVLANGAVSVGAGCVAVGHRSSAKGDAAVGGALCVEEPVCQIPHRLTAGPADTVPNLLR